MVPKSEWVWKKIVRKILWIMSGTFKPKVFSCVPVGLCIEDALLSHHVMDDAISQQKSYSESSIYYYLAKHYIMYSFSITDLCLLDYLKKCSGNLWYVLLEWGGWHYVWGQLFVYWIIAKVKSSEHLDCVIVCCPCRFLTPSSISLLVFSPNSVYRVTCLQHMHYMPQTIMTWHGPHHNASWHWGWLV